MAALYEDEDANETDFVPLLLDDVGEGELPRSKAPFFTVPSELLRVIIQYVDRDSLSSFALTSWDCLQLARTRLFASVSFEHGHSSISLIAKLKAEGEERVRSPTGRTSRPSIGACIQCMRVDTRWLSQRLRFPEDDNIVPKRSKPEAQISSDFFDSSVPALISIFKARPRILPHLEFLDWQDNIAIPELLSNDFSSLQIKHLRVCRVWIDSVQFKRSLPSKPAGGWPLDSPEGYHRHGFVWDPFNILGVTSSCVNIVRLCASTLVSLTWQDLAVNSMPYSLLTSDSEALQFPCLRELGLGNVEFKDLASLATLLGTSNLVTLVANIDWPSLHEQFFKNHGKIHSLETFVWDTSDIPMDHPLDFLRANQQLSKFKIPYPVSSVVLETRLLPLLSSSFKSLCSLSLVWEGARIPASALKIISTIKSLEQIHLSAGNQDPRYDWAIDHKLMRICLSSLPHLQKVAFSCDSYIDHVGDVTLYYAKKALDLNSVVLLEGEDLDREVSQNKVWERLHRERMLAEARKYIDAFPKLEWLYMGQISMSVVESQTQRGLRQAITLCPERVELPATLGTMFG